MVEPDHKAVTVFSRDVPIQTFHLGEVIGFEWKLFEVDEFFPPPAGAGAGK